jgi:hypothetical protein
MVNLSNLLQKDILAAPVQTPPALALQKLSFTLWNSTGTKVGLYTVVGIRGLIHIHISTLKPFTPCIEYALGVFLREDCSGTVLVIIA